MRLLGALVLLAGCAVNSGIQALDLNTFFVSRQGATGAASPNDLRLAALQEATAYCHSRNQEMEVEDLVEAQPPFILGHFPKAEVRFRCVPR
jgi:hypothetical protein